MRECRKCCTERGDDGEALFGTVDDLRTRGSGVSLKAFHVVFVSLTMLLCGGFGVWAIGQYRTAGDAAHLAAAVSSFGAIPVLLIYGRWFLRKLRHVGYL